MDQGGADPLSYLINFGAVGVFLVLLLTGVIATKREVDRERERAAEWKSQFEAEAAAHGTTLRALERERERGDMNTEASRTTVAILDALQHRAHPAVPGGDGP